MVFASELDDVDADEPRGRNAENQGFGEPPRIECEYPFVSHREDILAFTLKIRAYQGATP